MGWRLKPAGLLLLLVIVVNAGCARTPSPNQENGQPEIGEKIAGTQESGQTEIGEQLAGVQETGLPIVGEKPPNVADSAWLAAVEAATDGYRRRLGETGGLLPEYTSSVEPKWVEDEIDGYPWSGWVAEWDWKLPGDVNADWQVDGIDLGILARYWGADQSKSARGYSDSRDLNSDGLIDEKDAQIVGYHFDAQVLKHQLIYRRNQDGPWTIMPSSNLSSQLEPVIRCDHRSYRDPRNLPEPANTFKQDPAGLEMRVQFLTVDVLGPPEIYSIISADNGIAVGYEVAYVPVALLTEDAQGLAGSFQSAQRENPNDHSIHATFSPSNIGQETLIFRETLDEPVAKLKGVFEYWIDDNVEPYKDYEYFACTEYNGTRSVMVGPLPGRWHKQLIAAKEMSWVNHRVMPPSGMSLDNLVYVGGQEEHYKTHKTELDRLYPRMYFYDLAGQKSRKWDFCVIQEQQGAGRIKLANIRGKPAAIYSVLDNGFNLFYARATCRRPKNPDDFLVSPLGRVSSAFNQTGSATLIDVQGRPMVVYPELLELDPYRIEIVAAMAKTTNPLEFNDWNTYPLPGKAHASAPVCARMINGKPAICCSANIQLNEPVMRRGRLEYFSFNLTFIAATNNYPGEFDWTSISFDYPEVERDSPLDMLETDGLPWIAAQSTKGVFLMRAKTGKPVSATDWLVEETEERLLQELYHVQLFDLAGLPVVYGVGKDGPVFAWPDPKAAASQPFGEWNVSLVPKTRDELGWNYSSSELAHQLGFLADEKITTFERNPDWQNKDTMEPYLFSLNQYELPIGAVDTP